MRKITFRVSVLVVCALFFVSGCQTSFLSTPTVDVNIELTDIAKSVDKLKQEISSTTPVVATQGHASDTPLPATQTYTQSPSPTFTIVPVIPTETAAPTLAPSATMPEPPQVPSLTPTLEPVSPTPTLTVEPPAPTPSTEATVPKGEEILFKDDFSSQRGWASNETDTYRLGYDGGGYLIEAKTRSNPIWSVRSMQFEDTLVEVDAVQQAGAGDGYFGIICRHQDLGNYYLLVVSSDGTFAIGKVKDKELKFLTFTREFGSLLKPQGNQIGAGCIGDDLSLFVNGQMVLQAKDSDFSSGSVGMVAGNLSSAGTKAVFDNFIVYAP